MVLKAASRWAMAQKPLFESESAPQLKTLSERFSATRLTFLGECLKAAIEKLYPELLHQEQADCPLCQGPVRRKRFEPKEISTLQGRLVLERPYFYCRPCGHGFSPLDQALGLAPGFHQSDVQNVTATLAAKLPYEEAAQSVERLTGVPVGEHFAHQVLTAVGRVATLDRVIPDPDEIERRIQLARGASGETPVLVMAADGAKTPVRPKAGRREKRGAGGYREVRGARLYLLDPDDEILPIASWHQIQTAEAFRADLARIAQRIPQDSVRICLVADGAEWVWKAMAESFPQARQILDFYHAFEHLHVVARAQWGEKSLPGHQWAESMMIRLADAKVTDVLDTLRCMTPRTEDAREEIRKLIGYLEGQSHRLHYFTDLAEGYPIGSGAIESANKFICHARMKRSGAWWVEETGNDMLRVRCALYNGTFDRVFQHYMESQVTHSLSTTGRQDE